MIFANTCRYFKIVKYSSKDTHADLKRVNISFLSNETDNKLLIFVYIVIDIEDYCSKEYKRLFFEEKNTYSWFSHYFL